MSIARFIITFSWLVAGCTLFGANSVLETPFLQFSANPDNGSYEILDKQTSVRWKSNPYQPRFGEVTLRVDGKQVNVDLAKAVVEKMGDALELRFQPVVKKGSADIRVTVRPIEGGKGLEFSYAPTPSMLIEKIRLLDQALWVSDNDRGYVVVPAREGLLIPADSGLAFSQSFDTFNYEGCHMEMFGVVKQGTAALVSWHDPYVAAEIKSALPKADWLTGKQALSSSVVLRKSARAFQVRFLGRGDYVNISKAYQVLARQKGWYVPWETKLKQNPERAKLFGAVNAKLWSTLSRSMNDESTQEVSKRVNWTFDEAAQVAEHLKNDLQMDKVFFILGGWIHRGYDNQHPDILPAAPECGGDAAFAEASQRILKLGYVYGLHDNYQDMYRDAPSWDESFIQKNADGSLYKGGKWAGGRAYFTCAQKAVELAKRPQNLTAVKKLSNANAYFIDTTYAVGLQECFDPKHPLTRWDDMKWKQALSDYSREVFGIFGSECGREWAIPHADFFEGLTGVGGKYYHYHEPGPALEEKLGARVVPLFELVYRECIALYGKYGYDSTQAAEYVLHHALMGRTLHYHSIPSHLYWKEPVSATETKVLKLSPSVASLEQVAPRQLKIKYRWQVDEVIKDDWRIFVHFSQGKATDIKMQNDQTPNPSMAKWPVGVMEQGPFTITVPLNLTGIFQVRMGLFQSGQGMPRAHLTGSNKEDRSVLVGKLKVTGDKVEFEPVTESLVKPVGDPGLFVRADHGWMEGKNPMDRFMKNTYEILSPLNELTSQMPMTGHQFLTLDGKVQRSVFGLGTNQVTVTANKGGNDYTCKTRWIGEAVLPPNGLVIEAPGFGAYCVTRWKGGQSDQPVLFTVRSQDAKPITQSAALRFYKGFGDLPLDLESSFKR